MTNNIYIHNKIKSRLSAGNSWHNSVESFVFLSDKQESKEMSCCGLMADLGFIPLVFWHPSTALIVPWRFDPLFQLAGKVFTHKCDTGNLSALIQC